MIFIDVVPMFLARYSARKVALRSFNRSGDVRRVTRKWFGDRLTRGYRQLESKLNAVCKRSE